MDLLDLGDRMSAVVATAMVQAVWWVRASRVVIEPQEHCDEHEGHHQAVLPEPQRRDAAYRLVAQDAEPVGDNNQRGLGDHRPRHLRDQVPGRSPEAHPGHHGRGHGERDHRCGKLGEPQVRIVHAELSGQPGLVMVHTFLETGSTILIVEPILLPVLQAVGVDLVHFGVVVLLTPVGILLPPIGIGLYTATSLTKPSQESAARSVLPFVGALLLDLLLVIGTPGTALTLPSLVLH